MAPRRPTAPHAGAARARAARSPVPPPAAPPRQASARQTSRQSSARSGPSGRAGGSDRAAGGRGPARPSPLARPVTMLSGVLVVLVLLLAPYVRPWVTQRSQIAEANEQMRRLEQEVEDLSGERRRWEDPAYIKRQARERLHFVMPGETGYVVLDDSPREAEAQDPRDAAVALPGRADQDSPWYATLWRSVQIAGDPTTEQARSAAVAGSSP